MQQNILIVEDDADIAESLQYNLRREGYRPTIAESGEKGLRLALDEKNARHDRNGAVPKAPSRIADQADTYHHAHRQGRRRR